jgi:predicted O-linked N-acetylglucosamine transferase (SPINDLY family)
MASARVQRRETPERTLAAAHAHYVAGRHHDAAELCHHVLSTSDNADALHLLGAIEHAGGHPDAAAALMARAVARAPKVAAYHANLGAALHAARRHREAAAALQQAAALDPKLVAAHFNLGNLLRDMGDLAGAVTAYARALRLKPDYREALNNIAVTLWEDGRPDQAAAYAELAVSLYPDSATTHLVHGEALRHAGRLGEATTALHNARLRGADPIAVARNLGHVLLTQGDIDGAIACMDKALADPAAGLPDDRARLHSSLLFTLNYRDDLSPEQLSQQHRAWPRGHAPAAPLPDAARERDRDPERPLRIGYVSPDFVTHSVASFLEPLLAAHDRNATTVHCYSGVRRPDAVTQRLAARAALWRNVYPLTDQSLAELIRADRVDILVDLSGHTADNRLCMFALKPAPVQVSWLGYPSTTGLAAIDWRLSDAIVEPSGDADALSSERILRLPHGFHCFQPPAEAPPVGPAPGDASGATGGRITFGSLNTFAKLSPATLRLWARILAAVPTARLLLKDSRTHDPATARHHRERFAAAGIDPARLDILPRAAGTAAHLAAYGRIDVALDPFPYNGTTTTCEALWMGVPVIALAGDRHAARVGASLLHRVGLDDLVAADPDAYVAAAVALARDPARIATLRGGLRARMQASPLCDGAAFARAMEAAYRAMWRAWCASGR